MSLTVPTGGVIAGRAANVRAPATDAGESIAQLGRAIQEKQKQWQDERSQMDMRRTQLDIARDMGAARLEVEQLSDPDEVDRQWSVRSAEIRERYLGPDENGQPRYDARTAGALDLSFTEMGDRHALALGNHALGLRRSMREAQAIAYQSDIVARAAVADPDTLNIYVEQGAGSIDDRLRAGTISHEQAEKEKAALASGIYGARASQMILDDPEGFLTASDADSTGSPGVWSALGDDLAAYRLTARKEVDRRAAAAARDAESQAKARTDAIGKRLDEMGGLMSSGFSVSDEEFLKEPEVQSHPKFAATRAAQSLRDETPGIQSMTVAELDTAIDAEMSRPKTHGWEAERVKVLRSWRDEAEAKSDQDYVSLARDTGHRPPELPDFDPADPGGFAQGLQARMSYDATATGKGWTRTQAVFSQDERTRLKSVLDPKSDPGPKIALAQAVLAAAGQQSERVFGILEADPVFMRATRAMVQTGNPVLAESILRGQQKMQTGTVNMPAEKQMVSVFDQVTGGAFDADPKMKAGLIGAARALYADNAAGVNPDGENSVIPFMDDEEGQDLFGQSVQRVLGASADRNGNMTTGGLQEVSGHQVYLPAGVAVDDVDATLNLLDRHLRGRVRMQLFGEDTWSPPAEGEADPDRLRAFRAASIDASVPNLGKDPARTFSSLSLQRVGESEIYELVQKRNGRVTVVPRADDPMGRAWRFSLKELMREARK